MTATGGLSLEVRNDLAESARWRLLSLLLQRPRPGWHEEVLALLREKRDTRLARLESEIGDAREGLYQALLGPGGAVSPREVAYRPMADPGRIFARLRQYYEAFAFSPQVEEPLDHITNEAGFLGYLKMKQAYARARGEDEAAGVTARALQSFIEEHLAGFVSPFAERLSACGSGYLSGVAEILQSAVQERGDL